MGPCLPGKVDSNRRGLTTGPLEIDSGTTKLHPSQNQRLTGALAAHLLRLQVVSRMDLVHPGDRDFQLRLNRPLQIRPILGPKAVNLLLRRIRALLVVDSVVVRDQIVLTDRPVENHLVQQKVLATGEV